MTKYLAKLSLQKPPLTSGFTFTGTVRIKENKAYATLSCVVRNRLPLFLDRFLFKGTKNEYNF